MHALTLNGNAITINQTLNAIPAAGCQSGGAAGIVTNQRPLARPFGGACDIGAVEVQAGTAVTGTPKLTG